MGCPLSLRRAVDLTFPHRPQGQCPRLPGAPGTRAQPVNQGAELLLPAAARTRRLDHGRRAIDPLHHQAAQVRKKITKLDALADSVISNDR